MTAAYIIFQRQAEPRENACTMLVPKGWLVAGGILRANHMVQIVTTQTVEAKLDMAVQREPAGQVMLRWCPEMKYCDLRMSPAGMMGMMSPPGSNYGGMIVMPLMPAHQFISQIVFPWAHPQGAQAQIVEQKPLPEVAQAWWQWNRSQGGLPGNRYDAGSLTYTYRENGSVFKEMAKTVIECLDPAAGGMWSNKNTLYMRAPLDEFDQLFPILATIEASFKFNSQWLVQEHQSQAMLSRAYLNAQHAEQDRARRALETQRYIQNVSREIVEHHQRTQAEIRNDQYLFMTNQEEYLNPYTNEVEIGTNQWAHRWEAPNGDVFYADSEGDNPNYLDGFNNQEWKKSEIRPRFPY